MIDPLPPDALCERCFSAVLPGEQVAKLAHVVGCTMRGDIEWIYTYVHVYDREEGCVRGTASVWD